MRDTLLQYLRGELLLMPQRTAYCWGHVDDTVAAHLLAMDKGALGESYITAGPPHPLIEALLIAEKITGVKAPRLRPVPELLATLATVSSVVEKVVPLPELYSAEGLNVNRRCIVLGQQC